MKNGWYLNPLAGPGSAHSSKLRPGASNPPPAASSSSSAIRTAGKSGASSGIVVHYSDRIPEDRGMLLKGAWVASGKPGVFVNLFLQRLAAHRN